MFARMVMNTFYRTHFVCVFLRREDSAIKNNNGAVIQRNWNETRKGKKKGGRTKKQRDEKRYNIWKRSETVGKTLGSPRTITTSAGYATHGSSFLSHDSLPPWLSIFIPFADRHSAPYPETRFYRGIVRIEMKFPKWRTTRLETSQELRLLIYTIEIFTTARRKIRMICIQRIEEDRNPFISILSPREKSIVSFYK